jgi:hypothetical protein
MMRIETPHGSSCDLARNPWLWPWSTALRFGAATLDSFEEFLSSGHSDARPLEPAWTTSSVARSMRHKNQES